MKRNAQIDALRAVSILIVLISHLGFGQFVPGGFGVTIFFGISGYIITALILKEHQDFGSVDLWLFYRRRFWKIAPPLFFLVVIPTLFTWKFYSISLEKFLSQLFFYFNWTKVYHVAGHVFPTTGLLWSLSIEEQFYIGIALFVILIYFVTPEHKLFRKYLTILMCTIWLLSMISRVLIAIQDLPSLAHQNAELLTRIYFGTDTRISSIASGALVAIWASSEHKKSKIIRFLRENPLSAFILALVLILSSLLTRDVFFRNTFMYSLQEIFIAYLIITGPVLNSWPKLINLVSKNSIVQSIGKSSYCLYLSHSTVLLAVNTLFSSASSKINPHVWTAVIGITCILFGYAAHRCFDSPFESKRIAARRPSHP